MFFFQKMADQEEDEENK